MRLLRLALATASAFATIVPASAQSANPIVSGAQTCTTSSVVLPGGALANGVILTADPANTGTIFVDSAPVVTSGTGQGYPLAAGQSISYGVTSLSAVSMICTNTTDVLHFTGN